MHRHLYSRNTACRGTLHNIKLTDDMKLQIIETGSYKEPEEIVPVTQTQNQQINLIINNINQQKQIINIINTFDVATKVTAFANRTGVDIPEFEEFVSDMYKNDVSRLQNNRFRGDVEYNESHFKNMVSEITQQDQLAATTVIFDGKKERLLFSSGTNGWDTMRVKPGIEFIVEILFENHLKYYEIYLIRKIELNNSVNLLESLEKYYSFINTFNIYPVVRGRGDANILYNDDNENYIQNVDKSDVEGHRIVDKYNSKYTTIRNNMTDSKKNATYKEVSSIVHQNIQNNLEIINQRIAELIQIEPDFLETIRPNQNHRPIDE